MREDLDSELSRAGVASQSTCLLVVGLGASSHVEALI